MAILAECPKCRTKQSIKNKVCTNERCDQDLVSAKRSNKVKYWLRYRLLDGKQKTELVKGEDVKSYSIEDARAMHSKRVVQKREGKVFDITEDNKRTFKEYADWYLAQEDIKSAPSYKKINVRLERLNKEIGHRILADIESSDLRNFRAKLEKENLSDSYIDDIITAGKTVVNRAFENTKTFTVGVDTFRKWKSVKKVLSKGDNARDRYITIEEYEALQNAEGEQHVKDAIAIQYWTGLRPNDVTGLELDRIDLKNRIIRFEVKRHRNQKPKPAQIFIVDELFYQVFSKVRMLRPAGEDRHIIQFNGNPIKSIETGFKRLCRKAKISYGRKVKNGLTLHDFRHTSITDMRRAGIDPLLNKIWHGHSTKGDAHSGYHTVDIDDLKRTGQRLQEYRQELKQEKASEENVTQNVTQTQK